MSVGDFTEEKNTIYNQSLFVESAVAKHKIGTIRELSDGRKYAYAKAGAALLSGELNQGAVPDTLATGISVYSTGTIGDKYIYVTYGAGTTATKDYFKDGYITTTTAAYGIGHMYKIKGHAAMTSGGNIKVYLYDTVLATLTTTTSKVILVKNPQDSVIQAVAGNPTAVNAGVNPIAVTSAYYFWNQVKGPAAVTTAGTVVVGNVVGASATAGAVMPLATGGSSIDVRPVLGQVLVVGSNTGSSIIMLAIPGY
jgi:hypothetical protein